MIQEMLEMRNVEKEPWDAAWRKGSRKVAGAQAAKKLWLV
jgi:hypothetical protein